MKRWSFLLFSAALCVGLIASCSKVEQGGQENDLMRAVKSGDVAKAEKILKSGAPVNIVDEEK